MANKKNRYQDFERLGTASLCADTALFIIFLISAGNGIVWLKTVSAIIAILTSVLAIGYLFLTRELLRQRSIWMSIGFAAIILCIVVSLICNYPSPNALKTAGDTLNPLAVGAVLLP